MVAHCRHGMNRVPCGWHEACAILSVPCEFLQGSIDRRATACSLLAGRVVYRLERVYGKADSVSARSSDHPVAGAVLHGSDVHIYVHHAPVGIAGMRSTPRWGSKRGMGVSRVVRYQMPLEELAALTRKGLAEL